MIALRLGTAFAVLRPGVGPARAEHDRAANDDLKAASGLADIVVHRRPSGRPSLAPPYPELGVSLSYRAGLLLIGFDPEGPVGVDIEPAQSAGALDSVRLAVDHFAPGEAAAIGAVTGEASLDLFLRLWVAKEAVLKLTGRGVYDGLRRPDLSGAIAGISVDATPVRIQASPSHSAVELAVFRPAIPGRPAPYCALARTRGV